MTTILKSIGLSMVLVAVYLLSFFLISTLPRTMAHETGQPHEHNQDTAPSAAASSDYTYIAQSGDTYSQMARKAIQTYGITEKVSLSPAKIIFAETKLTVEAGSPELNQGSSTTIKKGTVKKWVEAAQKLSAGQEALWKTYVPYVEFNTNKVGQAR